MQSKKKLLRADNYAVIWATNQIAILLSNFLSGRDHILEIGSEQGNINIWDDVIFKHNGNIVEHIQIKRQATDFDSVGTCTRGPKNKADSSILRELTTIDETLEALAKYYQVIMAAGSTDNKRFKLVLPDNSIKIKKEITVRILKDFRSLIVSTTTSAQMMAFEANESYVKHIFAWLTTWCGFSDWDHILISFKKLEILTVGEEPDLISSTDQHLVPYFQNVATTKAKIEYLFRYCSTAPNTINPRLLLSELSGELKTDIEKWTQYSKSSRVWNKYGIYDTKNIESPEIIVRGFWNEETGSTLKFNSDNTSNLCAISKALLRLAVHFTGASRFQAVEHQVLKEFCKINVGGTLGAAENDCQSLSFLGYSPLNSMGGCSLDNSPDQKKEAELLHKEMDIVTFEKVVDQVYNIIERDITSDEIKDAALSRWDTWKGEIDLKELCYQMMRPNIEGENIEVSFRVGPKTVVILAQGIFLLLVVSLGFDPKNDSFKLVKDQKIIANALLWWSGPSRQNRRVRSMNETDIVEMVKEEKGDCVVLSGTNSSLSQIYDVSLAEDFLESHDLAKILRTKIIFTNSFKIKRELRNGNIGSLQNLIKSDLDNHSNNIDQLLNNL